LNFFQSSSGCSTFCIAAIFALLTFAAPAKPQTLQNARLPETLNICMSLNGPDAFLCYATERHENQFIHLPREGEDEYSVEKFDATDVVLKLHGAGENTFTLTGKRTGNHAEGRVALTGAPNGIISGKWKASFYYPPRGDPSHGELIYAGCEHQVAIINTADDSVRTVDLPAQRNPSAIEVSADGSRAFVSVEGRGTEVGKVFIVNGRSVSLSSMLSFANTKMPHGFWSVALSSDGSTLYGVGYNTPQFESDFAVINAHTGEIQSITPLNRGQNSSGILIAGNKLLLADGTPLEVRVPGPPLFGSNSQGLAAFPDGQRMCSNNTIFDFATKQSLGPFGCLAVVRNGSRVYGAGQVLFDEEGSLDTNPRFGKPLLQMTAAEGGMVITPDDSTIYAAEPSVNAIYVFSTKASHLVDVIHACRSPSVLGIRPLTKP
jgi:hypothetical protein